MLWLGDIVLHLCTFGLAHTRAPLVTVNIQGGVTGPCRKVRRFRGLLNTGDIATIVVYSARGPKEWMLHGSRGTKFAFPHTMSLPFALEQEREPRERCVTVARSSTLN